jgi:hypothetical protein
MQPQRIVAGRWYQSLQYERLLIKVRGSHNGL